MNTDNPEDWSDRWRQYRGDHLYSPDVDVIVKNVALDYINKNFLIETQAYG